MTKETCTVYYVELTHAQHDELNSKGWDSEIGRAYLRAKDGEVDDSNVSLFKPAARLAAEHAEAVWMILQNGQIAWRHRDDVEVLTNFCRSMDVGDVIVWDQPTGWHRPHHCGRAQRCASIGFDSAPDIGDKIIAAQS